MSYQEFSDEELLDLLARNDHAAYHVIYERYSGLLYMHAWKRLRNREECRDLVQEIFLALWNRRRELLLNKGLKVYLYTAVRNRVIDRCEHLQVREVFRSSFRAVFNEGHNVTDHLIRQKQLIQLIETEVSALPGKMREVFELSRKANLSHRQIAEALNISEQTVRKQINNALKILRPKLGTFFTLL
ncbi:RNA polymerase subunit sigma-70 [Pedobacter yulinensis]|uniref:RNA polymerase subunit sigma-70 n=1 Tax=Pedobacter yulinensis TaxID=2126353 RepID=A0A2T3HKA3_9SPHI|nr:RNA polymerase sigma-70 factor [Pedobacter yulinensis]PST82885.1 RNA polymerase subunit sigma-70 [Pedobacter yulinensis]